jgi:hypothetical protein
MFNDTLGQSGVSSPFQTSSQKQRNHKSRFTRLACVTLLALSLGLNSFGAHMLDTSAISFSLHLLTSHHLYNPAPFAGGGCGATPSDC